MNLNLTFASRMRKDVRIMALANETALEMYNSKDNKQ
jgi:hypothetical protein